MKIWSRNATVYVVLCILVASFSGCDFIPGIRPAVLTPTPTINKALWLFPEHHIPRSTPTSIEVVATMTVVPDYD